MGIGDWGARNSGIVTWSHVTSALFARHATARLYSRRDSPVMFHLGTSGAKADTIWQFVFAVDPTTRTLTSGLALSLMFSDIAFRLEQLESNWSMSSTASCGDEPSRLVRGGALQAERQINSNEGTGHGPGGGRG